LVALAALEVLLAPVLPPALPEGPFPAGGGFDPVGGSPMRTHVAVTVPDASVPTTATAVPTFRAAKVDVVTSGPTYFVESETSTVTAVPALVVMVKVPVPRDFTVPTAVGVGGFPVGTGAPEGGADPAGGAGGAPMPTLAAVTVPEASVPKTATVVPTLTSAKVGEVTPGSTYFVAAETSTVTTVPALVVMVKVPVPSAFTVPTTAGLAPLAGGGVPVPALPGPLEGFDVPEVPPVEVGPLVPEVPLDPLPPVPPEGFDVPEAGPAGGAGGGAPMATQVAVTVPVAPVPMTPTFVPTFTSANVGVVTAESTYVVAAETSTVTVDPVPVVRVKVSVPTDATVPVTVGAGFAVGAPGGGAAPLAWADAGAVPPESLDALAATAPPMASPIARPTATTPARDLSLPPPRARSGSGEPAAVMTSPACIAISLSSVSPPDGGDDHTMRRPAVSPLGASAEVDRNPAGPSGP
jgi:hypothetical protein